jgi:hypothetical protein
MTRSITLPSGMPAHFNPEAQGLAAGPTQLQLQQALQQQAAKAGAMAPVAQAQAVTSASDALRGQQSLADNVLQQHKAKVMALAGNQLPGYQGVLAMGTDSAEGLAAAIGM